MSKKDEIDDNNLRDNENSKLNIDTLKSNFVSTLKFEKSQNLFS